MLDQVIFWSLEKGRWLYIVGTLFIVLGALYASCELFEKTRSFKGLTKGLTFSLAAGLTIGIGFGMIGLMLVLMIVVMHFFQEIPNIKVTYIYIFNLTTTLILIGLALGLLFGFIIGLFLDKQPRSTLSTKKSYPFLLILLSITFFTSFFAQYILSDFQASKFDFFADIYLNALVIGGCLLGLMSGRDTDIFEMIKQIGKEKFVIPYLLLILLPLIVVLVANFFNPYYNYYGFLLEFIIGFVISIALIQPRKTDTKQRGTNHPRLNPIDIEQEEAIDNQSGVTEARSLMEVWSELIHVPKKPNSKTFWFFHIFIFLTCTLLIQTISIIIFLAIFPFEFLSGYAYNLITVIAIIIGIRCGNIDQVLKQPRHPAEFTRDKDGSQDIKKISISWPRFIRGIIVGFIAYGIYTASFPAVNIRDSVDFYIFLNSAIAGGLPAGITIGLLYGFGPTILLNTKKLSSISIKRIGVFLGIIGAVLILIQFFVGG